jgi:NIPSNAP
VDEPTRIVELRQYTLKPGARDTLIDLFERHFIGAQEERGARILGHFRDLDDADRFVWLRGFPDFATRKAALEAFYSCDVWRTHRDAVNELIVDSDDVLLLRPVVRRFAGLDGGGVVAARIWSLPTSIPGNIAELLADEAAALLEQRELEIAATYVTEPRKNNFPALPVREGENVVVVLAPFEREDALAAQLDALEGSPARLADVTTGPPQMLRLAAATHSRSG